MRPHSAGFERPDELRPRFIIRHDVADSEAETELEGISGPGDSGGPAYLNHDAITYVAGISAGQSTRATGGREGLYGVTEFYTRVSSYTEWITATMESRQ